MTNFTPGEALFSIGGRHEGVIAPGAVLGVLGSGQLGRMFAIAARQMGYRVHVLSPDDDTPTGQVADEEQRAPYDDLEAVARFARGVAVVTFEFENVPAAAAAEASRHAPVRPAGEVLSTTQHRLREKTFLRQAGLPTTPFAAVRSLSDLAAAVKEIGCPAVLKTAAWGYDGKGQVVVDAPERAEACWGKLGAVEAIWEGWVDFEREVSVVAARGLDGAIAAYEPMANEHRHHILDVSTTPAGLPPRLAAEAKEIAVTVLTQLNVVGVLCVEMFQTRDGRLLVNELAPRPHNSGHLSIDAHATCQFQQQVRAVCGLPLGATDLLRPAAMANLLGELWRDGPPRWERALARPGVQLHLYGKRAPREGRKMGHLTALADTPEEARRRVQAARAALTNGG